MYQKFDSMYGRHITGSFAIKNDPYQGYIISGSYDNGKGDWNQSYLVTRLLASGSMIWTAKDNVTDISRYKRCDEVPAVKISLKNKKKSELSANSADYSLFFCIFALKLIIGFKV